MEKQSTTMLEQALITLRFKLHIKLDYFSSRPMLTCYCLRYCTVAITVIISQADYEKILIEKLIRIKRQQEEILFE